jgi:multidrug transporter EmrE-like cation transporter
MTCCCKAIAHAISPDKYLDAQVDDCRSALRASNAALTTAVTACTFAVLTSLSPAIAALAGWFVLHQRLGWSDCPAIALVMIASMGAIRTLV